MLLDELPVNATHKVDKQVLARLALDPGLSPLP